MKNTLTAEQIDIIRDALNNPDNFVEDKYAAEDIAAVKAFLLETIEWVETREQRMQNYIKSE